MRRTLTVMLLLAGALIVLTGCTVSTSLVPALSEEDGRFGIEQQVRQPFYAESDGLHKLTVRFFPEGFPGSQMPVDPGQGATIELNYAPDDDPRFPEPAFHEWPDHHEWLPELTGDLRYEQTFCSPYPDLSGIEVRVATYWGDLSPGTGELQPFETVEILTYPVVGQHVGYVPGGSEVEVLGASEGWAEVLLGDDQRGYIDMDYFAELPEPQRVNDQDVTLELFELDGDESLVTSTVNAGDMFDNSHVAFEFPVIEESLDECYRFSLTSPDSEPGNAITIRFDPEGPYEEGQAIINGDSTDGDIVFQPLYDLLSPLYYGNLDDYEWAAPLNAFEARFDPVPDTADRYLEVVIDSGQVPVNVPWSRNRPPGQRPLQASGMPDAPQGGLIFNAAFQAEVPIGEVSRVAGRDLYSKARQDRLFFGGYALLFMGAIVIGALAYRRGESHGR